MMYTKTPRMELDDAISYQKSNGNEYDDMDLDDQQKLCALYAATMKYPDEAFEKVDTRQILAYMKAGHTTAAGEYIFTIIQDFFRKEIIEEFLFNETEIESDELTRKEEASENRLNFDRNEVR